jgi:type IV secretion system protein TrbL
MSEKTPKSKRSSRSLVRWLTISAVSGLFIQIIRAQQGPAFHSTVPSQIMDQFRNQRNQWTNNIWVYANAVFGILAVIEFAWSAAVMLLEKTDLQSWTSALIRKLMWIGAFYTLLLNGRTWIPAIIDSFTAIGQNAAGLGALSPSGIFVQGLSLAGALMDGASTSAFFTNPGASLALAFAALMIVVSYTLITINFIVTLVESYLVVSVGFIFLGFGGSRWTAPYTERYIGLAVSIGIKIVLLYCLISAGMGLSVGWLDEAQSLTTSLRPAMTAFDVMGASLIFMMCCWQIPKLFAAVIGGAPALTGGDLIATAAFVGGAALAAGGAAMAGVGALAGGGSGTAAGTGSAGSSTTAVASVGSVGAGSSAGGRAVSPPSSSSEFAAGGGAGRRQPDPPTLVSALSSLGGEPLAGSGFETQPPQRGFAPASMGAGASDGSTAPERGPSPVPIGGVVPDVVQAGNVGVASPQPTTARRMSAGARAADYMRGFRRRLGSLPSDAAPHATPPRIPIEHQE